LLIVATKDGVVSTVETDSGKTTEVASLQQGPAWIHTAGTSEPLIYGNDGLLNLHKIAGGATVTPFAAKWISRSKGWAVRPDPTGTYVAIRAPDQFVRIFRTADSSLASYFKWANNRIAELTFSSDGKMLMVLSENGELAFWDTEAGKSDYVLALPGKFSDYPKGNLQLTSAGSRLVAVDLNGQVNVISLATFSVRTLSSGHPEPRAIARMSPDGALLATYSEIDGLRVWHLGLSEVLLEDPLGKERPIFPPLPVYAVTLRFSPDSRYLIVDSKYEESAVIKMPEARDELARQAKERLSHLPAAEEKPNRPAASKLRLGAFVIGVPKERAQELKLSSTDGAMVTEVVTGSPAMEAGVKINDVIVRFNNVPIKGVADLGPAVAAADATKGVAIWVVRQGDALRLMTTFPQ
jgi:PDZ domain